MPPHCDTMDGPVVSAARKALGQEDVNLALAYVPESAEAEVRSAFEKVLRPPRLTRPRAKGPICTSSRLWCASIAPAKAHPIPDSTRPGWTKVP